MTTLGEVQRLLTGRVKEVEGAKGLFSAIAKHPRHGRVRLGSTGLEGDEHAHPQFHGGLEKAVHHYPLDHYAYWREHVPGFQRLDAPGAFGENISTEGITENDLCVGDILGVGSAQLQVSQGRAPCGILDARFRFAGMADAVERTRYTGWYYRVLQEGEIAQGDPITLLERSHPEWTLEAAQYVLYNDRQNKRAIAAILEIPTLSAEWRAIFTTLSKQ